MDEPHEYHVQSDVDESHFERLTEIAKSFPIANPLPEDQLSNLNSLEKSFVIHQHRLLRIDRFCEDLIPKLDVQFCEFKRHLRVYNASIPQSQMRRMSKKTKSLFRRCHETRRKTERIWSILVRQLDTFTGERKHRSRPFDTVLETYETVKSLQRSQGLMKIQIMKLDRNFEEQGVDNANLLLRLDKLVMCKACLF